MVLADVEKRDDWLYSEWILTYRAGWDQICKAAQLLYGTINRPEVRTGDVDNSLEQEISNADDILSLAESGLLTIRGMSEIIKVPRSITFFNQLDLVRVYVACMNEEFSIAEYRAFNMSLGKFMDSIELAMYL
ncbi:MAG: hypothetical protein IJI05_03200 [Erysipelotrichaceae bacterium]|nr:hypothetical protein [Erysipelotrichaceae bacterium]